jgi:hypothetical protein
MLAAIALAVVLPTVSITVHASPGVSPRLVRWTFEEADAIWREAGVRIAWTLEAQKEPVPATPDRGDRLRVVIDYNRGMDLGADVAVGWVVFEGDQPRPEIHLSYSNALAGLERIAPRTMMQLLSQMRSDELVAIALGRALAHELGHYLLELKEHREDDDLMHASWTADELFGPDRPRFHLNAAQRLAIASKLSPAVQLTKR